MLEPLSVGSCRRAARRVSVAAAFVGLTIVAGPAAAQAPETAPEDLQVMTLEEVVQRALLVNPQMAQAEGSVRSAEATRLSARGSYLPTINASSNASRASTNRFNPQTNTTVTGSSNSYSAALNASLDVWNGGRRGAEINDAGAALEAARATAQQRRFDVVLSAKVAFYDVLRRAELMRVSEARIRRARESLAAAERRLQVGTATRSDVLRSQLELNDARQAELTERTNWTVATYALGRVVGVEDRVGAESGDAIAARALALSDEELRGLVLETSPAVVAAGANLRSARAGVGVARSQYFPTLRATSNLNWFNQEFAFDGGTSSWNMGLAVSLPVFNGFQRESAATRARVAADVAEFEVRDARRAARVDLERLLGSVRLAEERLELTAEAVEVAREDLRVQDERYRLGASTILDLITSQLNLAQAETDEIAARYDYQIARAELEALVGREL
ncbi:MAG: TolC family protein [Gemmatimonadota bacterium]